MGYIYELLIHKFARQVANGKEAIATAHVICDAEPSSSALKHGLSVLREIEARLKEESGDLRPMAMLEVQALIKKGVAGGTFGTPEHPSTIKTIGMVQVVLCPESDGSTTTHIFSTPQMAQAFKDRDPRRPHVTYEYLIDAPERHEGRPQ